MKEIRPASCTISPSSTVQYHSCSALGLLVCSTMCEMRIGDAMAGLPARSLFRTQPLVPAADGARFWTGVKREPYGRERQRGSAICAISTEGEVWTRDTDHGRHHTPVVRGNPILSYRTMAHGHCPRALARDSPFGCCGRRLKNATTIGFYGAPT